MQVTWGSWSGVLIWLVGLAISVLVLLAAFGSGLWLVKKLVGEQNFPALTMLVAVVGALVALNQANSSTRDKQDQQARTMAFASDVTTKLMFSALFTDTPRGVAGNVVSMPADVVRIKLIGFQTSSKVLAEVDMKDMPSALSMGALLKARAGADALAMHAQQAVTENQAADFDRDVAELADAAQAFQSETTRLYPVYKLGPVAIGKLPMLR